MLHSVYVQEEGHVDDVATQLGISVGRDRRYELFDIDRSVVGEGTRDEGGVKGTRCMQVRTHTGSRQKVSQEASASQLGRSKSHANCGSKSYQNVNPRPPPPDAMMGSCPRWFLFPTSPSSLPASPLFLRIFIHLACFASLLPDSFGPVQGTMGIRREGNIRHMTRIFIYLL